MNEVNESVSSWNHRIDAVSEQTEHILADFKSGEINKKPSPDKWSIGEVLHHLITVNESYFESIRQIRAGQQNLPFGARIPFLVKVFGNSILKSVKPENLRKTKTFPVWAPDASQCDESIINRFTRNQWKLKEQIEGSIDLMEKDTIISSPASRLIVYKLQMAFEIIITHEERHLLQILELTNWLNERKAAS